MSQPIQTQSQQFAVFGDDSAKRAIREPVATVYVDHDIHDYLAGPSIHAGLNVSANRRQAALGDRSMGPLQGPLEHPELRDESLQGLGFTDDDYDFDKLREIDQNNPLRKYGPEHGPYHPGSEFNDYYKDDPEGVAHYDDLSREQAAREWARTSHRQGIAIGIGGSPSVYDSQGPYGSGIDNYAHPDPLPHQENEPEQDSYDVGPSPYEEAYAQEPAPPVQPLHQMLDEYRTPPPTEPPGPPSFNTARRQESDGGPELRTGLAVAPAQPGAPAAPVWLGHTYVPGHRVEMPWRDGAFPGTITHLEGYNIGVLWDDGQHTVEEPQGVRPLY